MDGSPSDERGNSALRRARQEREVAMSYALAEAEFALVREGVAVGRALASVGLSFDPSTFAALRVLEASVQERLESLHALSNADVRDLIARSATRTMRILAEDPPRAASAV